MTKTKVPKMRNIVFTAIVTLLLPFYVFSEEKGGSWNEEDRLVEAIVAKIISDLTPEDTEGGRVFRTEERFVVPIDEDGTNFTATLLEYTDSKSDGWGPGDELEIDWFRSTDRVFFEYKVTQDGNSITHWQSFIQGNFNMNLLDQYDPGTHGRKCYKLMLLFTQLRLDPDLLASKPEDPTTEE